MRYHGLFGHIIAEFKAAGFYELIRISGANIQGQAYPLIQGVHNWADSLFDTEHNYGNTQLCMDRFQDFLCDLIPTARNAPHPVARAAHLIEDADGLILISELSKSLCVSEGGLSRHFKEVVGVTPKYFARIVQFNRAMDAFANADETYLTALAHDLGYYDQAHFNKSIRQFLRTTHRASSLARTM